MLKRNNIKWVSIKSVPKTLGKYIVFSGKPKKINYLRKMFKKPDLKSFNTQHIA